MATRHRHHLTHGNHHKRFPAARTLPTDRSVRPFLVALAYQFFRAATGVEQLRDGSGGDHAPRRVVDLCGRLPLAIRIAAARLRTSANHSLTDLETNLSAESDRLGELKDDDRSVAASFRVSLNDLPSPVAGTFMLLGLHL